jgi:adenylate cyclase class 1
MDTHPVTSASLADELRAMHASADSAIWDRFPETVERILKVCDGFREEDSAVSAVDEVRMLLCRMASRTAQCAQGVFCGRALLHLGRPGRMMALDIFSLSKWGEQEVISLLDELTPLETLFALHQSLAAPSGCRESTRNWAEGRLEQVARFDPVTMFRFFVHMGREGNQPVFILGRHLLESGFLPWFQGLLKHSPSTDVLSDAVYALHALGDASCALSLAGHVHHLPAQDLVRFCRTAAELCRDQGTGLARILVPQMVSMPEEAVFATLRCLILVQCPRISDVMDLLGRKRPALEPCLRHLSFFLPNPWSQGTASDLVRGESGAHAQTLFAGLCRIDPCGVARICSAATLSGRTPPDLPVLLDRARSWKAPAFTLPEYSRKKSGAISLGQRFARLFTKKDPCLKDALHTYGAVEDLRFKDDLLDDRVVSKCTIKGVDFTDCVFTRTVFDRVRFVECTFVKTRFEECTFKECTFSRCTYRQCTLTDVVLQGSVFEFVDFYRVLYDSCFFTGLSLVGSLLDQAGYVNCSLDRGDVSMCVCRRLFWSDCRFSSFRLIGSTVTESFVSGMQWHGVEIVSCRFTATMFQSLVMRNVRVDDTELESCVFQELDSQEPVFLGHRLETIYWDSRFEAGEEICLPKDLDPEWVKEVLMHWRHEQIIGTTEQCMLANNRRRLGWAVEKFSLGQDDFFRLIPCLLHSSRFEEYMDLRGVPGCRIDGFEPDYTQMRLLDTMFPFIKERSRTALQSEIVHIAAVYTIGSLGTVAQNRKSDVDVWICLAGTGPDRILRSRLVMKCEELSRWAKEEYDLELHFFVMTMDEIRSNNFGVLSGEGSGSAQALLLKEEFYRTALLVAGRFPGWWSLPCWSCNGRVVPLFEEAMNDRSCDLGKIDAIPREEFFGASLWQIVGSAKNPYKALLKLGLLEKYASQGASPDTMLSEVIKANLLEGKKEVFQIDPYGLLYKELLQFYDRLGEKEGCTLLRESFYSKVRMEEIDLSRGHPRRQEEQSILSSSFPSAKITREKIAALSRRWSTAKTLELGEAMSTFMLGAYKRIQGKVSAAGANVSIRPEEMTMLGRTILSYFGREPGKVRRMFFIDLEETDYQELYFYTERSADGTKVYAAKARGRNAPRILDRLEVVRRDHDPVRLAAWLCVNGLYKPGVAVSGTPTLTPVSVSFLQGLMNGVLEIFPPLEVFRARQEDLLEERRIRKILCFLQKGGGGDDLELVRADILYATSWGELYAVSVDHPPASIRSDPTDFFARNLCCPLDWEVELYQYRASTGRTMPLTAQ